MSRTRKPRDITIRRGDTYRDVYTLRASGAAIDITSYTFLAQLRESADSATILATFDIDVIDAAAGQFAMVLDAATTAALDTVAVSVAAWDIQFTSPGGDVVTFDGGVARLKSDVART